MNNSRGLYSEDKRVYNIWHKMHERCENPEIPCFPRYGGRGISVCQEWEDGMIFYAWALDNGYEKNLSIDRINNDGNYEPGNCRWVTQRINCRNKGNNVVVEKEGVRKTLIEWADQLGIGVTTLYARVERGWPTNKVLAPTLGRQTKLITAHGKTLTIAEWAKFLGIPKMRIGHRLRRGWPPERAMAA